MKCTNCGVEVADGMRFCTSCGTPIAAPATTDDSDKTVLVSQDMVMDTPANNPLGQPAAPQANQFTSQPQMGQPMNTQFTGQPQMGQPMNTQFTGQPQMGQPMNTQFTGQPQMGQPMNTQFTGQPQMGQPMNTPYAGQSQMTQGMNTQYTGQPQMTQGMYASQPYGQPNMMYNQPPKPPKKPLSPKAKKGIIIGAIVAALAILFFVVILPIITRAKFQGEYINRNSYYYYKLIADNGTYAFYDEDGNLTEAGTYTIDDDEVEFVSISNNDDEGTFNSEDNKLRMNGDVYKSTDEDAKLNLKITKTYLEDLQNEVETITNTLLTDEEIYEEFEWGYYFIYMDDLDNPYTLYEQGLADALDYDNDPTLQALMEGGYLTMDIYMYDGEPYIEISAY